MNAIHAVKKRFLAAGLFFAGLALFVPNAMAALSVSITSPASNSSFTSGATVTINASASPTNGRTVTKVQFYYGESGLRDRRCAEPANDSDHVPCGQFDVLDTCVHTDFSKRVRKRWRVDCPC
jgi:hypothetical protein